MVTPSERAHLEAILRAAPQGMGLQELIQAYAARSAKPISERTMRRRLRLLQADGAVRSEGFTTAARYFAFTAANAEIALKTDDEYIALSTDGRAVRDLVVQPVMRRAPVGYNESFLYDYHPGTTSYLTEAQRLHLHDLGRTADADRPAGTFARDVFERLLIDLAWASSKLEGNTYSRLDTQNLLENGIRAPGTDATEATMILNHKKAIELLVDQADTTGFNRYTLFNLHAALAENLLGDPMDEGKLRVKSVFISGTVYVPLSIPQKIDELFSALLDKARAIADPFEQAFFAMVHLPYLQPFVDVNKRTSRLAANISLIKANLCPLSFIGVPEKAYIDGTLAVYEFNRIALLRDVFLWAYERSSQQYRIVRDAVVQPNPVRARYRAQLNALVTEVVIAGTSPRHEILLTWAVQHGIEAAMHEAFAETALGLLVDLHEGAIARYGLRPSQFRDWKAKIRT